MEGNSKRVKSPQDSIHKNLEATVRKYLNTEFRRPFAHHSLSAFKKFEQIIQQSSPHSSSLILDACCGTAVSTVQIAKTHPDSLVIGVDQSSHRLDKLPNREPIPDNCFVIQSDLLDFYRLLNQNQIRLYKQLLLYPNPWPKPNHLKRRWHAMPCFPDMLALGGQLEVRSNWETYIDEFQAALVIAGYPSNKHTITVDKPITAFEEKYDRSGHSLFQLDCDLNKDNK